MITKINEIAKIGEWNRNTPCDVWINAKTTTATLIQAKINQQKEDLPLTEQIPKEYHQYLDVFDKNKAERFPESWPWDHKIELKEGFQPKLFKTYNLTPEEQKELDNWIKENLDKGYIRPSQSPMASPFFYIKKKDGKLQPCQGYCYLNEWTIKNAYPLPLILELMDKIQGAKYFTNLTYIGDTTIFGSRMEINGKRHSKPTEDFSNPQ